MEFTGDHQTGDVQGTLPQFSELRAVPSPSTSSVTTSTAVFTSGGNAQSAQNRFVYTNAARASPKHPMLEEASRSMKYMRNASGGKWPERLLQLRENIQSNRPNYGQNNPIFDVQSNSLEAELTLGNICASQAANTVKQEMDRELSKESDDELHQRQVTQYFQKLQATSLPHTLQQLIKQTVLKKEKEEEKIEHTQNSILNIPHIIRNIPSHNDSSFPSSDSILGISSNINLHVTEQPENEGNFQPVLKEQQVQTDSPKFEKKSKFRAKLGEIKVNVSSDGVVLYCCPECNIGLPDKADIEQHVQAHLQERKYQCKECGAMLKRKEHLDQHMRGHSDDRPFVCTVCQKGFKRNEHLTRHYVIHSGDKNFSCTKCQKAFSRKDHLNKHMQTHLGIRKGKTKEDSFYIEPKDKLFDRNSIDIAMLPKQEISYTAKDDLKQEVLLHHFQNLQNLQKNQLFYTFTKEQTKDTNQSQQEENISLNELLIPQDMRYLLPS